MKIGIDARVITDKNSGLVNYVKNFLTFMNYSSENHYYIFCNPTFRNEFSFLKDKKNCSLVDVYFSNKFLDVRNLIYEYTIFKNIVNKLHIDLFHCPFGYGVPPQINAAVLITIHDLIPLSSYDELKPLQKIIYKYSLNSSLKLKPQIVSISEFTKREIINTFPTISESLITVIYNGFDNLSKYCKDKEKYKLIKATYNLPDKYISYLGSGTKRKNLVSLIKGYAYAIKEYKIECSLVIISKFDRKETIKIKNEMDKIIRYNNLEARVFFLGYLEDESKALIMHHSRFFIYPSLCEGFGLPLLEAMSCSTSVICSNISPFKEVCSDAAYYFNPEDYNSIANAIKTLAYDDNLRRQLIQKGEKRIALFKWEKMVNQYEEVYKRICQNRLLVL